MNQPLVVRLLLVAGCILPAAVNYTALSRVADNRQGQPDAHLWLTERELPNIHWFSQGSSGMGLRLVWRTLSRTDNDVYDDRPSWLGGKKLEELGFQYADAAPATERRQGAMLSREVYIVLEYNGSAYLEMARRAQREMDNGEEAVRANPGDKSLQSARQQAKKRLRMEHVSQSRLFAVDAGMDPQRLRASYPDASRFIVAPGLVRLTYRIENGRAWATGQIAAISVDEVHVPLNHRLALEKIIQDEKTSSREGKLPRYQVELLYGSRREPWIAAVRPLEEHEPEGEKSED